MHKLNHYNQEMFDSALAHGIDLTGLRKKYGIKFALKLFKKVYKDSKKKNTSSVELITPKNWDYKKDDWNQYRDLIESCGFKFNKWVEDFVDEDTGEIVPVGRWELLPLK